MIVETAGLGVVTSAGAGLPGYLQLLKQADSSPRFHLIDEHTAVRCFTIGFDEKSGFTSDQFATTDDEGRGLIDNANRLAHRQSLPVKAAISSALQAWFDAGMHLRDVPDARIGLVISGSMYNDNYAFQQAESAIKLGRMEAPPRFAYQCMDSNLLGVVSELFHIKGASYTVAGATASGNVALINGCHLIASGMLDYCLVLAPPVQMTPLQLSAFSKIGALSECDEGSEDVNDFLPPFDMERAGFVPGEVSGCVLLARQGQGTPGYGYVTGTAMGLDAHYDTAPKPERQAAIMAEALSQSGLNTADIDYINAHATGTQVGDACEIQAIKSLFGDRCSDIYINSTKSIVGHGLTAAGLVESIAVLLQMKHGFMHPNRGLVTPMDDVCAIVGADCIGAEINNAISNSYGFSGINTSIVFSKGG